MVPEQEIRAHIGEMIEKSNEDRGISPEETERRVWRGLALRTFIQSLPDRFREIITEAGELAKHTPEDQKRRSWYNKSNDIPYREEG